MEPALGIIRCPLVQLALEVKYPLLRHIDARETERRCSPATSFRPIVLRTHWTPSPCGRLSLGPATTTTGPPPRPGGNSGRCACPEPEGFGGHRRDASHVHHRPVGRVGAQLYPGRHRRALPQHGTRPRPPEQKTDGRDGPQQQRGPSTPTAHSRQFRGCCQVSGLLTLVRPRKSINARRVARSGLSLACHLG